MIALVCGKKSFFNGIHVLFHVLFVLLIKNMFLFSSYDDTIFLKD